MTKEKKMKVKKQPKLWLPTVFGLLALVFLFMGAWVLHVGGPRIDMLSMGNVGLFFALGTVLCLLAIWRVIAYYRFIKRKEA